jgi:hypothetical protein
MIYGLTPSKLDGTEIILDNSPTLNATLNLPLEYSYKSYLPNVLDQGNSSICVPCSLSAIIDWKNKMNKVNFDFSLDWIWDCREDKNAPGMSIKEALAFMKKTGYISKDNYKNKTTTNNTKILSYARLLSKAFMQRSLLINGPFIVALNVKDDNRGDFWNGSKNLGGHAVCCVGYNKDGFILRNSWGQTWNGDGYTIIPFLECGKILEAWAII